MKPDLYYSRDGINIKSDLYISATQAILGGSADVTTIHGKQTIKIAPGSIDGTQHNLSKQGFNKLPPNDSQRGDHVITLKIAVPSKLTDAQRKALQAYADIETKPDNI